MTYFLACLRAAVGEPFDVWESTKKVESWERVRRGIYRGEEMLTVEVELESRNERDGRGAGADLSEVIETIEDPGRVAIEKSNRERFPFCFC